MEGQLPIKGLLITKIEFIQFHAEKDLYHGMMLVKLRYKLFTLTHRAIPGPDIHKPLAALVLQSVRLC